MQQYFFFIYGLRHPGDSLSYLYNAYNIYVDNIMLQCKLLVLQIMRYSKDGIWDSKILFIFKYKSMRISHSIINCINVNLNICIFYAHSG